MCTALRRGEQFLKSTKAGAKPGRTEDEVGTKEKTPNYVEGLSVCEEDGAGTGKDINPANPELGVQEGTQEKDENIMHRV